MKKLTTLTLAGLTTLIACDEIRTEYSKPTRTEINFVQHHLPSRSETEPSLCISYEGDLEPCMRTTDYPEAYITIIRSNECVQEVNNKRLYDHFKQNNPETLEYVDVYRNTYSQRPNSAEKETILLESKKVGCEFKLQF